MLLAHLVFAFGLTLPIQAPAPKPPAPPTIEEVVARALQTHPEILAVEAKLAGVKAELELAKLSLSQRVLKAKFKLEVAQSASAAAEQETKEAESLFAGKLISNKDISTARANLQLARVQLKEAEAEWKMYAPDIKRDTIVDLTWTYGPPLPPREAPVSPADRDRFEALERTLKLKKSEKLDLTEAIKLLQPQPELKGLTLRVPHDLGFEYLKEPPRIASMEGEMTVAGWLQFLADEFNPQAHAKAKKVPAEKAGQYEWYVREYGLVFENVEIKPVGAPTLAEFLKAMRAAPAPKK